MPSDASKCPPKAIQAAGGFRDGCAGPDFPAKCAENERFSSDSAVVTEQQEWWVRAGNVTRRRGMAACAVASWDWSRIVFDHIKIGVRDTAESGSETTQEGSGRAE